MAAFFFDSSAIVKRYLSEAGTTRVLSHVDPAGGNQVYLAMITGVEVVAAICRRARGGTIPLPIALAAVTQFRHDFANQYQTVEITNDLLSDAMALAESHGLRAYDAVQLAAALELTDLRKGMSLDPLTVISSDKELNAAALLASLQVEDPSTYP